MLICHSQPFGPRKEEKDENLLCHLCMRATDGVTWVGGKSVLIITQVLRAIFYRKFNRWFIWIYHEQKREKKKAQNNDKKATENVAKQMGKHANLAQYKRKQTVRRITVLKSCLRRLCCCCCCCVYKTSKNQILFKSLCSLYFDSFFSFSLPFRSAKMARRFSSGRI